MAKSIRRIRVGAVAYYLNKAARGGKGGNRFYLYRTLDNGRTRDGRVQLSSTEGHALAGSAGDGAFFDACKAFFASKTVRYGQVRKSISGPTGRWEGEAFKSRPPVLRAAQ